MTIGVSESSFLAGVQGYTIGSCHMHHKPSPPPAVRLLTCVAWKVQRRILSNPYSVNVSQWSFPELLAVMFLFIPNTVTCRHHSAQLLAVSGWPFQSTFPRLTLPKMNLPRLNFQKRFRAFIWPPQMKPFRVMQQTMPFCGELLTFVHWVVARPVPPRTDDVALYNALYSLSIVTPITTCQCIMP